MSKTADEAYQEWEAKWRKQDFSWGGLAEHEWNAPVDFPGPGEVAGEGETAYKRSNLQEYWRWSRGVPGYEDDNRLLTDEELLAAELLTELDGTLWHVLHLQETDASKHLTLAPAILARLEAATGDIVMGPDNTVQATGARVQKIDHLLRQYGNVPDGAEPPRLHVDLRHAELANFVGRELRFGTVRFDSATFMGTAWFDHASFRGAARFDNVTFTGTARFHNASFTGPAGFEHATFIGDATFNLANFTNGAGFERAIFTGDARFNLATFTGATRFDRATFESTARFRVAVFKAAAWFNSATFTGDASFHSASFERTAQFTEVRWGWHAEAETWEDVHYGRAFFTAKFRDTANFETDHFNAFAAFDGAQFDKALYLREEAQPDAHKDRFDEACAAVKAGIEADVSEGKNKDQAATDRWNELSSGYRTAKAVMERHGAVDRAQRYYAYEVQARIRKPTIGRPERFAADIYGLFSDYGASISRPLIGLAGLTALAPILYLLLSAIDGITAFGAPRVGWAQLGYAVSFSFKNALLNLDPLGGNGVASAGLFESWWMAGFARLVGAVQSAISLILAFLFGLAVRRKFQIR